MPYTLNKLVLCAFVFLILSISSLAAPAGTAHDQAAAPITKRELTLDPDGFVHLAQDGVQRSYTSNGTVIDYRQFSNAELLESVDNLPASMKEHVDYFKELYANVDGHDVTDPDQLFSSTAHTKAALNEDADQLQTRSETHQAEAMLAKRDEAAACNDKPCDHNSWCTDRGCLGCFAWLTSPAQWRCFA